MREGRERDAAARRRLGDRIYRRVALGARLGVASVEVVPEGVRAVVAVVDSVGVEHGYELEDVPARTTTTACAQQGERHQQQQRQDQDGEPQRNQHGGGAPLSQPLGARIVLPQDEGEEAVKHVRGGHLARVHARREEVYLGGA